MKKSDHILYLYVDVPLNYLERSSSTYIYYFIWSTIIFFFLQNIELNGNVIKSGHVIFEITLRL